MSMSSSSNLQEIISMDESKPQLQLSHHHSTTTITTTLAKQNNNNTNRQQLLLLKNEEEEEDVVSNAIMPLPSPSRVDNHDVVNETDELVERRPRPRRRKCAEYDDGVEIECIPGYHFIPTDHELIVHYLLKKVRNQPLAHNMIPEVELYKSNPEELTERSSGFGEKEWYFFTPRDRKYRNGTRPNRAAGSGYWKATGADKPIMYMGKKVGHRKALVFYHGKAPKGDKTNWIMHEFRVEDQPPRTRKSEDDMRLDDWVLCRIYKKDDKGGKIGLKDNGDSYCTPPYVAAKSPPEMSDDVSNPIIPNYNQYSPLGAAGVENLLPFDVAHPMYNNGIHQFNSIPNPSFGDPYGAVQNFASRQQQPPSYEHLMDQEDWSTIPSLYSTIDNSAMGVDPHLQFDFSGGMDSFGLENYLSNDFQNK